MSRKTTTRTWYYRLHWSCLNNEVNGNIFITLVVYVKHMKKSKWLDWQGNEFFPKQKGTPSLVKIEHKNTATLDSARSKKNLKSQFCNYGNRRWDTLFHRGLQTCLVFTRAGTIRLSSETICIAINAIRYVSRYINTDTATLRSTIPLVYW